MRSFEWILLVNVPLRPPDHFSRLIVFYIEPMACEVGAVPLPLPFFAFLNSSCATFWGAAKYGEEYLHERVVGIVVASPLAIDYTRKGGLIRAFFECERHDRGSVGKIYRDECY